MSELDPAAYSGVHTGPLRAGEWVSLTDAKGHRKSLLLEAGKTFHTTKGGLAHAEAGQGFAFDQLAEVRLRGFGNLDQGNHLFAISLRTCRTCADSEIWIIALF